MKRFLPRECDGCPMNRRRFLTRSSAATVGALGWLRSHQWLEAADSPAERTRIRVIYALHAPQQPGPDWPNQGFDFRPVMERVDQALATRCAGFDFLSSTATGPEQAKQILDADQAANRVDGYLVYQMNCWNQVVQTIATSGKPVLYADFQYGGSGGFLVYNAAFLRNKAANVGFVASSNLGDLVEAVKCFALVTRGGSVSEFVAATANVRAKRTPRAGDLATRADDLACLSTDDCLRQMKASRVLAVRDQNAGEEPSIAGIPVQKVPFAELNEAWKNADRDETRAVADRWESAAAKVEGVSRETLEASAAMYLAEKALLKRHHANAITINCLGGFYGGHIHAYPCLGFHQLLNEGLVGGCECDVRSAATMVIGSILTRGRPGYISDPVMDSAKRQIIYAHCVAANRAFGPAGPANPFEILTHSEDRQGASVRSVLPTGYLTTTLEFDQGRKEILLHQARAVDNDPDDRACRTKLCAEPLGDFEKLFREWDHWGWHRVTFYGDLKAPIYALADALGWRVVEEA
ncbi:MAG: hypothetical protein IPM17_01145 [Verrucomicrobia bacterium]|nr:hypothetical protein [Verrucomicrobiota bacterium]